MARLRVFMSVALIVGLVAIAPSGLAFASAGRIGPNQHFLGYVNGKHRGAVVYTVCPGPIRPGETGPIAGNQNVEVERVSTGGGDTGSDGHAVYSYIPGGPAAITRMRRYETPEPIPTSARVPCQGSGIDYFSTCPLPQPCGAGAKTDQVAVTFEDIAV